jgi:urease accessory protein
VYRDNTRYEPEWIDMQGLGMYEGYTHLANLVICNEEKTDEWIGGVRELLDGLENIEGGVTRTKAGHVVVRMLGKNAQKLTDVMGQIILHN